MRNGLVIDKENFPATLIMQSLGGSVAEWLACRKGMVQIAAATLSGNSPRQTVHTDLASVHQAAKLVAAVLRVARVTAGVHGGKYWQPTARFMTHITRRLTAKNRDQLRARQSSMGYLLPSYQLVFAHRIHIWS